MKLIVDIKNPITLAVMPLKDEAIRRSIEAEQAAIDDIINKLEKQGYDINAAFPYPSHSESTNDAIARRYWCSYAYDITTTKQGQSSGFGNSKAPRIVEMRQNRIKQKLKEAGERAAELYDAFIIKLCSKIGPVKQASLEGEHIWGLSILTVHKTGDIVEQWQTKEIMNVSKYGHQFPQWPTRRLKKGEYN